MPVLMQMFFPYVIGGTLFLAIALFGVASWYFRRSRREPYWVLRRDASRVGWRLFLISLALFGVAGVGGLYLMLVSLIGGAPDASQPASIPASDHVASIATTTSPVPPSSEPDEATPNRPLYVVETASLAPSATRPSPTRSSVEPSATPSVRVSATSRPPTSTAVPASSTPVAITPLEASVTPSRGVRIVIDGIAAQVNSDFELVDVGQGLVAGLGRVYFTLSFSGMTDGIAWERMLLRDGEVIQGGAYLWRAGETGTVVHFFGNADGLPAGEYAIRITLAGELAAERAFSLE